MIDHERTIGAGLRADSLTAMVTNRPDGRHQSRDADNPPAVARVNVRALDSVEAAARPELEVLGIGVWEGEPLGLAPVAGLPRLRTLTACPGTLADPWRSPGSRVWSTWASAPRTGASSSTPVPSPGTCRRPTSRCRAKRTRSRFSTSPTSSSPCGTGP